MKIGTADLDEWEILLPEPAVEAVVAVEANVETEGLMMLRLDYFSADDNNKMMMMMMMMQYSRSGDHERSEVSNEGGGSDNPSWIDPAAFPRRTSEEFWPDSSSDQSKLGDCDENLGLGFGESDHNLLYDSGGELSVGPEIEGVEEVEKLNVVAEVSVERMDVGKNPSEVSCVEVEAVEDGEIEKEVEQPVNEEKKPLLWWKLPLELVKFCVFRISPVWSISVAAAMVGVFIIRRRLHMMKRKTKGLQMKVTMDDKKVDQFMSRAARLNEAFSVVRRIPIIRPSLHAPGVTPWPVVSIR